MPYNFSEMPNNSNLRRPLNYKEFNWQSEKILIADDDHYTAILLEKILLKVGSSVILARDGAEALKKLTSDPEITIAILDILMPHLTGYEVVQKACPKRSDVIYIAFTADVIRIDHKKCSDLGFFTCIPKPVFPMKILNTINDAILYREQTLKSL
jgi:CheY-like chemotaxis protein